MAIQQETNRGLRELALFAGAGGGILGWHLLGWRTVCAVEWDAYAASVMVARQNDGCLPPFPIWDQIQTFDGIPWRGRVDVVSGGFPCTDISAAGKGAGINGPASGMWKHMARIIGEVRPRFAFVENSPVLTSRGLGTVLGDLAAMGYDARWGVLGACDAGAPHKRDRIWIVAYSKSARLERRWIYSRKSEISEFRNDVSSVCHAAGEGLSDWIDRQMGEPGTIQKSKRSDWWATEPDVGRVAHGVASRVDRLKAIGNGQVPAVARLAWEILSGEQI